MAMDEAGELRLRLQEVLGPRQAEMLMRRLPEDDALTKEYLDAQFVAARREFKEHLKGFATKDDLKAFATKDDLKAFATKDDLKAFATKEEMLAFRGEMREEFAAFRGEMREEFAAFRGEVRVEMRDLMREQTRNLTVAMVGTMITLTGAVITAGRAL